MCALASEIIKAIGYNCKVYRFLKNDTQTWDETLDIYSVYDPPAVPVPYNLRMPANLERLRLPEPFHLPCFPELFPEH